ncbi:MAG: ATP-dependent nuclease, partial [Blastocatellia bacterium]
MKLKEFRVLRFRNIIDSEPIPVEPDVTVLVGKNESGKTAILEALYRLNPVYTGSFSLNEDYPRWQLVVDRRKGETAKQMPIEAIFALEDADRGAIEGVLGRGVLQDGDVAVSRNYGDPRILSLRFVTPLNQAAVVANIFESLRLSDGAKGLLSEAHTLAELQVAAQEAKLKAAAQENAEAITVEIDGAANKAKAILGDSDGETEVAKKLLLARLPRFFYFSSYHILPGRIDLDALAASANEEPAASPDQTARSLLRLAQTDPQTLMGEQYEERKAELEAVSNDLSRQVFEHWTQNPDLRVEFDVDRTIKADGEGVPRIVSNHLEVRVQDRRHDFTNNFSQRSSGFRWFFSFLAAFAEFEGTGKKVIVLLDEPGLALHAKAQADFLRFINERLAKGTQVIYTTHSPFMVETDRLHRARIVQDNGPDKGATATTDVLLVDHDSVFPLQAALGYDLSQHLMIGDANLLVEGSSDFVYLDCISRFLRGSARDALE